jgi:hypothetical protein
VPASNEQQNQSFRFAPGTTGLPSVFLWITRVIWGLMFRQCAAMLKVLENIAMKQSIK